MAKKAAARASDKIKATDIHMVQSGNSQAPQTCDFDGALATSLSTNVRIGQQYAALAGSGAENLPHHVAKSGSFVTEPSNQGSVDDGSGTVKINSKAAARHGDPASTCTEPPAKGNGQVEVVNAAQATVFIGD